MSVNTILRDDAVYIADIKNNTHATISDLTPKFPNKQNCFRLLLLYNWVRYSKTWCYCDFLARKKINIGPEMICID